jgi:hypothetical protein
MVTHNNTASSEDSQKWPKLQRLVMPRGRGIWILAKNVRVAIGEDFHHPPIKVIHWMVHDWFEAAIVLSMCFFNVVFQSDADIFVLAA